MPDIVVALDVADRRGALELVDRLPGLRWVKIGSVLFVREGPGLVAALKDRGLSVFLDLKWHDIPNTVAGAVRASVGLGVDLATVHSLGGARMIEAAVEAAGEMRIAAVTVLTSLDQGEYAVAVGRESQPLLVTAEVARLARVAVDAGAGAIVASVRESDAVRREVGADPWIVVPGIRPQVIAGDDQQRVGVPEEALENGATLLVVGRPIYQADEPARVFEDLCERIG